MRKRSDCPEGQWGPIYNINAGATFRRREGALLSWSKEDRQAYGKKVEDAILASQAAALRREVSLPAPVCASHSWANRPGEVGDVVRQQQRTALLSCPARERAAQTLQQIETAYVNAMPSGFIPSWERAA